MGNRTRLVDGWGPEASRIAMAGLIICGVGAGIAVLRGSLPSPSEAMAAVGHLAVILVVGVLVLWGAYWLACHLDPVWQAGGAVEVDDGGVVKVYRKRLFRRRSLAGSYPMTGVEAVSWDIYLWDATGTVYIKLWDQEPRLALQAIGIRPEDPDLQYVLKAPATAWRASPAALRTLKTHVAARGISCNVDLETLDPIPALLPPMVTGMSFDGPWIRCGPS